MALQRKNCYFLFQVAKIQKVKAKSFKPKKHSIFAGI